LPSYFDYNDIIAIVLCFLQFYSSTVLQFY